MPTIAPITTPAISPAFDEDCPPLGFTLGEGDEVFDEGSGVGWGESVWEAFTLGWMNGSKLGSVVTLSVTPVEFAQPE